MTKPGLATSSALLCDFSQKSLPSGAFFSLRCLIYKVHAVPGGTLLILQNLIEFVKYFFQKFFDARSVSYHQQLFKFTIPFSLCQELFSKFFDATFQYGRCLRRFRAAAVSTALTALLEYQTIRRLSTAFYKFFSFFE